MDTKIQEADYKCAKNIVQSYERDQRERAENCYEFNLNDHILINLTPEGISHWVSHYSNFPAHLWRCLANIYRQPSF